MYMMNTAIIFQSTWNLKQAISPRKRRDFAKIKELVTTLMLIHVIGELQKSQRRRNRSRKKKTNS